MLRLAAGVASLALLSTGLYVLTPPTLVNRESVMGSRTAAVAGTGVGVSDSLKHAAQTRSVGHPRPSRVGVMR